MRLNAKIPNAPVDEMWRAWKDEHKLVGPRQRADHVIAVVGTGLAGASAASTLAGMGYQVEAFCYQDSARRAHSIAAQGGINATKDYSNDGDSVHRLFTDTIKGGDFRAREANVWRLAELSTEIIDQAVAQGVPFNREYGGLLATRSFGGVLVERTFYCRGQTGQQLLLGAYGALMHQVAPGPRADEQPPRDARRRRCATAWPAGVIARDLVTGEIRQHPADAVVLATGGYSNVYYLSTNAMGCNVTAGWRAHKRGAGFANPCFTQIHPTCIPSTGDYQSKLTLMSESLRNDGRIWVPRDPDETRPANDIPEATATTSSRSATRASATSSRATWPRARRRSSATTGLGRRPHRPRRLPRLPRRDLQARRARHRGPLRQPLRALRADHRRQPLGRADADLPGAALLDGRAVGRLHAADDHPRPVRDRRGQLLRPRRQPARGQRDDAVPRRRLLHPAPLRHRLPGAAGRAARRPGHPAFAATEREVDDRLEQPARRRRHDPGRRLPPRAGQPDARPLLDPPRPRRPRGRAAEDPRHPRSLLVGRQDRRLGERRSTRASSTRAAWRTSSSSAS